jgi:hypothetical protein
MVPQERIGSREWRAEGRDEGARNSALMIWEADSMSFGEWVQKRRVHALVLTIPVCTVAFMVGAVIFRIFPLTWTALWSMKFLLNAIFWGVCLGVVSAFSIRPLGFLKKE